MANLDQPRILLVDPETLPEGLEAGLFEHDALVVGISASELGDTLIDSAPDLIISTHVGQGFIASCARGVVGDKTPSVALIAPSEEFSRLIGVASPEICALIPRDQELGETLRSLAQVLIAHASCEVGELPQLQVFAPLLSSQPSNPKMLAAPQLPPDAPSDDSNEAPHSEPPTSTRPHAPTVIVSESDSTSHEPESLESEGHDADPFGELPTLRLDTKTSRSLAAAPRLAEEEKKLDRGRISSLSAIAQSVEPQTQGLGKLAVWMAVGAFAATLVLSFTLDRETAPSTRATPVAPSPSAEVQEPPAREAVPPTELWRVEPNAHPERCQDLVRLELPPHDVEAAAELKWKESRRFMLQGKKSWALRAMCESHALDPEGAAGLGLATYYLAERAFAESRRFAQDCLKNGSKSTQRKARQLLGDVASQEGKQDQALEHWLSSMGVQEKDWDARARVSKKYVGDARAALRAGDASLAERLSRRAVTLDTSNAEAAETLRDALSAGRQSALVDAWSRKIKSAK